MIRTSRVELRAALGRGSRRGVAAGAFLHVAGCALAPPGPRGPLRGAGVELAADVSAAYASLGTVRSVDDVVGSDSFGLPISVLPRRAELRLAPVGWLDVGADSSLIDGGVDVRLGVPTTVWPALSVLVMTGVRQRYAVGALLDDEADWSVRSTFVRAEAYPLLWRSDGDALEAEALRLVLAGGLHWGVFEHSFVIPETNPEKEATYEIFTFARWERRVELAVGVDWEAKPHGVHRPLITAVLQPYYQLESRSASAFDAHPTTRGGAFGVALIIRGALRWLSPEEYSGSQLR